MPVSVFSLFLSFIEKEYQTESNWPTNLRRFFMDQKKPLKQKSWARRVLSHPQGWRARPIPLGASPYLVDDLETLRDVRPTLEIPINTETPEKKPRSGVPLPQACVAMKNQSGTCSGTLPKRGIHHRWPSSSSRRSPWWGGSSSPSVLRVCTSSYVFDLSLSLSLMFLIWHDFDVPRALLL